VQDKDIYNVFEKIIVEKFPHLGKRWLFRYRKLSEHHTRSKKNLPQGPSFKPQYHTEKIIIKERTSTRYFTVKTLNT
jgi:hypothetical protein